MRLRRINELDWLRGHSVSMTVRVLQRAGGRRRACLNPAPWLLQVPADFSTAQIVSKYIAPKCRGQPFVDLVSLKYVGAAQSYIIHCWRYARPRLGFGR